MIITVADIIITVADVIITMNDIIITMADVIITHQNPAKPVSLKTVTQLLRKAGHALESVT
eukprot:COSAG06_NODE_15857_length_1039_cov_1.732979_1_plen_60_part_10